MQININITRRLCFIYILNVSCNNHQPPNWLKGIIKSLKTESRSCQTMLIFNESVSDSRMSKIAHKIGERMPLLLINQQKGVGIEVPHFRKIDSMKDPRSTTTFIILDETKNGILRAVTESIMIIKRSSMAETRPKCMIIHFSHDIQNVDYEDFLRKMWINLFLDLSIIDVQRQQTRGGKVQENLEDYCTLHFFNPLTDDYIKQEYLPNVEIFPKKLLNLWGDRMNVGAFDRPPFSFIKRNSTGHPIKSHGIDNMVRKLLSKVMNFTIFEPPSDVEFFGKFSCNKNESNGFTYHLLHNQIQIINGRSISTKNSCKEVINEYMSIGVVQYVAVAPIFQDKAVSIWVGHSLSSTTGIVVLFLVMIHLISRMLKFDHQYWDCTKMMKVILGLSVPELPRELKERIIFGSVVIISFVYSSNIYAAVTDFHLQSKTESELNTLKAVNESKLKIIINSNYLKIVKAFEDSAIFYMLNNKENQRIITPVDCMAALAKEMNFVCFMRKTEANFLILKHKDSIGRPMMKVVQESLFASIDGYLLEPGSPYVEHFKYLTEKMFQAGLIDKWEKDVFRNFDDKSYNALQVIHEINPMISIYSLISILLFGYSASIFAFFVEIIVAKFKK